jgi:hypothetical protein
MLVGFFICGPYRTSASQAPRRRLLLVAADPLNAPFPVAFIVARLLWLALLAIISRSPPVLVLQLRTINKKTLEFSRVLFVSGPYRTSASQAPRRRLLLVAADPLNAPFPVAFIVARLLWLALLAIISRSPPVLVL